MGIAECLDYTTGQIVIALRLLRLPHVTIEAPRLTAQALEWAVGGMDFADALHLARCTRNARVSCRSIGGLPEPQIGWEPLKFGLPT